MSYSDSQAILISPGAVTSDLVESFQFWGLSYQSKPEQHRPDPRPQAFNTWTSTGGNSNKKPRKDRNFLGLRLDLASVSNFKLKGSRFIAKFSLLSHHFHLPSYKLNCTLTLSLSHTYLTETDANHLQDGTETQARNPRVKAESLALPVVASPLSPAYPVKSPLSKSAMPILGSSKLRTLKLERLNHQKSWLHGIKTALKRFLRVPKGKTSCGKLNG
jgi:hypothetical protein